MYRIFIFLMLMSTIAIADEVDIVDANTFTVTKDKPAEQVQETTTILDAENKVADLQKHQTQLNQYIAERQAWVDEDQQKIDDLEAQIQTAKDKVLTQPEYKGMNWSDEKAIKASGLNWKTFPKE